MFDRKQPLLLYFVKLIFQHLRLIKGQLSLPSLRGRQMSTSFGWDAKVWFIPLADVRGMCR